jgi:hypothetical protein
MDEKWGARPVDLARSGLTCIGNVTTERNALVETTVTAAK